MPQELTLPIAVRGGASDPRCPVRLGGEGISTCTCGIEDVVATSDVFCITLPTHLSSFLSCLTSSARETGITSSGAGRFWPLSGSVRLVGGADIGSSSAVTGVACIFSLSRIIGRLDIDWSDGEGVDMGGTAEAVETLTTIRGSSIVTEKCRIA